jgi:hypothetical protein
MAEPMGRTVFAVTILALKALINTIWHKWISINSTLIKWIGIDST